MRCLVTGSREFANADAMRRAFGALARAYGTFTVVHGACPVGADAVADAVALEMGLPVERHEARWAELGRRAGVDRNATMVASRPDLVLVFPGGAGTRGCAAMARRAGLHVVDIRG